MKICTKETLKQKSENEQIALNEILELGKEILESRRKTNPSDIWVHVDPYDDSLYLSINDLSVLIEWDRYETKFYNVYFRLWDNKSIHRVRVLQGYDGSAILSCFDSDNNELEIYPKNEIIEVIHKTMLELAKNEEISFNSKLSDYSF